MTATTRLAANLRPVAIAAACVGAASVAVLTPMGLFWGAVFGCLGLALGVLNMMLVRRSAAKYALSERSDARRRFAMSVLGRLAVITAIALGFAVLVQPYGLGVFAGLAVFQFLMIIVSSIPLLRQIRQGAQA